MQCCRIIEDSVVLTVYHVQEIFEKLGDDAPDVETAKRDETHLLEARGKVRSTMHCQGLSADEVQTGFSCDPVGGNAHVPAIQDGIGYLNSLNGGCWVNPRSCARISCSYNSAIFLCNDVSQFTLPDGRTCTCVVFGSLLTTGHEFSSGTMSSLQAVDTWQATRRIFSVTAHAPGTATSKGKGLIATITTLSSKAMAARVVHVAYRHPGG